MSKQPSPAALRAATDILCELNIHEGWKIAVAEIIDREFAQERQRAEKLAFESEQVAALLHNILYGVPWEQTVALQRTKDFNAALAEWKGGAR